MVSSFYQQGSLLRVEVKAGDWPFGCCPWALTATHVTLARAGRGYKVNDARCSSRKGGTAIWKIDINKQTSIMYKIHYLLRSI